MHENYCLITELLYTGKGAKDSFEVRTVMEPNGTGEIMTMSLQFYYLSIPMMIKPQISNNYYLLLGPRYDKLIGRNEMVRR